MSTGVKEAVPTLYLPGVWGRKTTPAREGTPSFKYIHRHPLMPDVGFRFRAYAGES